MEAFIPHRIFTSEGWYAISASISNREKAFALWILVLFVWVAIKSPTQTSKAVSSGFELIKIAFSRALRSITLLFLIGAVVSVVVLRASGYWELSLLKETIIWFFSVALLLYYHLKDIADFNFFKVFAFRTLSVTIILPSILHFFTFTLTKELIIAPVQIFFVIAVAYYSVYKDQKNDSALKLSKFILSTLGLIYIIYAAYMIISNPNEAFSGHSARELLLSAFLTLLFLPFGYMTALWFNYASVFHCINLTTHGDNSWTLKKVVINRCGLNVERIARVRNGINYFEVPSINKLNNLATAK